MLGFCFLGHFCTREGKKVRGTLGGTLTVRCAYGPGWESYKKWLCRGNDWHSCKILVKTTGSEQLKGRASIQENRSRRIFTVTLEDLRREDADTYWCGIERTGNDLGYKFSVVVDPSKYYPSCALGPWGPPPEESGLKPWGGRKDHRGKQGLWALGSPRRQGTLGLPAHGSHRFRAAGTEPASGQAETQKGAYLADLRLQGLGTWF
uniref:Immunoglobulin domain-containing protein n=1 Tax=Panthera leo TaxID=9689 RepID=A0A8C8WQ82_PANLE